MPLSLFSEEIVGKWIQKNSYDSDYGKYYTFLKMVGLRYASAH